MKNHRTSLEYSLNSDLITIVTSSESSFNLQQLDGNDSLESSQPGSPTVHSQPVHHATTNSQNDFLPGEKKSIAHRMHPDVPEPCWVEENDTTGWCFIDQVGA